MAWLILLNLWSVFAEGETLWQTLDAWKWASSSVQQKGLQEVDPWVSLALWNWQQPLQARRAQPQPLLDFWRVRSTQQVLHRMLLTLPNKQQWPDVLKVRWQEPNGRIQEKVSFNVYRSAPHSSGRDIWMDTDEFQAGAYNFELQAQDPDWRTLLKFQVHYPFAGLHRMAIEVENSKASQSRSEFGFQYLPPRLDPYWQQKMVFVSIAMLKERGSRPVWSYSSPDIQGFIKSGLVRARESTDTLTFSQLPAGNYVLSTRLGFFLPGSTVDVHYSLGDLRPITLQE